MEYDKRLYELSERFARANNASFDSIPDWIKKRNISAQRKNAERALLFGAEMFQRGYIAACIRHDKDPYEHVYSETKINGLIPDEDATERTDNP